MTSRIGVIVPTLNCATTLNWTLTALMSQKDCTVRIIAVDSGSTDGTLDIFSHWGVQVVYEPPGNMYRAINKGIRLIDTEWCTYLNGDDIVFQDSYARLMKHGDAKRADIVYGLCDFIDFEGRFLYPFEAIPVAMLAGFLRSGVMGFAQPAAIFRAPVYRELDGFDEKYRMMADLDFFARAILAGKRFMRLPGSSVAAFRLYDNQLSTRESGNMVREKELFMQRWGRRKRVVGWLALQAWRILNIRNYVIRFLRNSLR